MRSARECLEADANVTTDTEASADVELTTDLHFERGEPDREQVGDHADRSVGAGGKRCAQQITRVRRIVQASDVAIQTEAQRRAVSFADLDLAVERIACQDPGRRRTRLLARERLTRVVGVQATQWRLSHVDDRLVAKRSHLRPSP